MMAQTTMIERYSHMCLFDKISRILDRYMHKKNPGNIDATRKKKPEAWPHVIRSDVSCESLALLKIKDAILRIYSTCLI